MNTFERGVVYRCDLRLCYDALIKGEYWKIGVFWKYRRYRKRQVGAISRIEK